MSELSGITSVWQLVEYGPNEEFVSPLQDLISMSDAVADFVFHALNFVKLDIFGFVHLTVSVLHGFFLLVVLPFVCNVRLFKMLSTISKNAWPALVTNTPYSNLLLVFERGAVV